MMSGRSGQSVNAENGPCKLWLGGHPEQMQPVDDPKGLGAYQLAVEALIRDESPDVVYLYSDDQADLSVVRKALVYLSRIGGQVAVAWQLPDAEVAEIFGVTEREYQGAVINPNGPIGMCSGA
nr:hypothetical protein [Acidithiobacillus montserratensis]